MSKLLAILKEQITVQDEEIQKAISFQVEYGGRVENILENMGVIDESDIIKVYALYFNIPQISLGDVDGASYLPDKNTELQSILNHESWIAFRDQQNTIFFLTSNPFSRVANNYIQKNYPLAKIKLMLRSDIAYLIKSIDTQLSEVSQLSHSEVDKLKEAASEAPVVNLLNGLFVKAIKLNASDMHIEPFHNVAIVRYRIDGVLSKEDTIASVQVVPLSTRLKILSNMDISEKRRPQDGKIETRVSGQELDIRVSCLPLSNGESFVLRFLKNESLSYDLQTLGMELDVQQLIERDIRKTSGVILLTGPTGSGKTTTLYSCLSKLNSDKVKIITLEDPVEYQLDNINQVQINPEIDFGFAEGLRSIVRQDPDIIMLGEIRDSVTAQIAMQSAITGHLVFSTVHTNDAASAYSRLLDLGVDEFLLDAALESVIAQRLARKLCSHCAVVENEEKVNLLLEKYHVTDVLSDYDGAMGTLNIRRSVGCEECNHTGYKGRIALIEYMSCDEDITTLEKGNSFLTAARKINKSKGYRNLLADGFVKALAGKTTFEEVVRVAG